MAKWWGRDPHPQHLCLARPLGRRLGGPSDVPFGGETPPGRSGVVQWARRAGGVGEGTSRLICEGRASLGGDVRLRRTLGSATRVPDSSRRPADSATAQSRTQGRGQRRQFWTLSNGSAGAD